MESKYLRTLFELCDKSLKTDDIPIGAIIIYKDKVIGTGYNTRERDENILGHAEVNAILEAQKILGNWNLSGSVMYVTLKPCSMCSEIIKQSRISEVYYLLDKPETKKEYYKTEFKKINDEINELDYEMKLSDFFKKLRNKK